MNFKTIVSFIVLLISIWGIITVGRNIKNAQEIILLHSQYDSIIKVNDSLHLANNNIKKSFDSLYKSIQVNVTDLHKKDSIIIVLNKKRNEAHNFVNALDADSVSSYLSKYIQWKRKVISEQQRHTNGNDCIGCEISTFRTN